MTHESIWRAIDTVAENMGLTPSGLARACSLDATSFNKSKRISKYGQPHWPSIPTIAKVISFAGLTDAEFFEL